MATPKQVETIFEAMEARGCTSVRLERYKEQYFQVSYFQGSPHIRTFRDTSLTRLLAACVTASEGREVEQEIK